MINELRILHLEDDPVDAELISQTLLMEFPNCSIIKVETQREFEKVLKSNKFDLILSDFSLPGFNGLDAMQIAHKLDREIPYVFVSGHIGEDRAIEALKMGATDYVLKDRLNKLVPTVNRVLKEREEKRKRLETERALVLSENKYKTLFESASDAIFLLRDMKYFDCNLKAVDMFRTSREQIIGKTPFDFSPEFQTDGEESVSKGKQKIIEALNGYPQFFEWKCMLPTGEELDAEINLSASKINGEPIIQAIVRNITERKKNEARIIFLSSLSFENPNPVFRINKNCELIFSNPAGKALLKGMNILNGKKVPGAWCDYVRTSFERGRKSNFEYSLNEKFISFTVAPIISENYVNFYGMDITALKEAEAAINLLSMAIDQSPASIIITDTSGNIKYVNNKFSVITGYSKEEVIGKNPRILKSGLTPDSVYKDLWRTISKGNEWRGEFTDRSKKGDLIIEAVVVSPVTNKRGKITAYLAVKEDITLRRQIEEKLKHSEEYFRTIFEISPFGIANVDITGRFIRANKAVENILGYTEEELKEKTISDLTFDEDVEKSYLFLGKFIQKSQQQASFEKRYIKKGGQIIWVNLTISGVHNDQHELLFTVTMIEDITLRKEAELAIKYSEYKYRSLFEQNLASVCRTTLDGNILEANSAFVEMMGYSSIDEVLGVHVVNFYPSSDDRGKVIAELVRNKEIKGMEIHWLDKNRNKKWLLFNASLMKDELTSTKYILSTIFDITEKKKAVDALKESEEKFRELVENIQDIIFSMDLNGLIEYVSPAIEDILGYKPEEIIGKNFNLFLTDSSLRIANDRLDEFRKGKTEPVEFYLPTRNGDQKWVRISRSPIIVDDLIVGLRGVISDITEKKNAEEELISAKNKAEEMNRLKSNFLANMGHELRTPLIAILGGADFLRYEIDEPECKEMAEIIYEGGQRLLETLNQLLDLSKIEADKYEITWTNIDINEIINEVSKSFLKFAEKKNLFIKLNLFPNPIILKSDERMLRGILNNLINNALKFTETGGVKISTSVKSNNVEFDRSVVIEVIDSGIGIPEDKIELIFEEFRQISEGYARDFQGTGLGLTITKKLVELLHGNISVVSSQGDGSVFRIEFPLRKETITNDENNIASAAISESNFKHDFKIICLEDDKATRRIIKNYLVDIYPTYLASTNSDFLNEISNIQYDLILLDINLGTKQSGLDILKIVKNMSTYKDTPVIALTAYAMKGDHELFLSKGFTDYLSKPFTKDQLLTLIKSYHE